SAPLGSEPMKSHFADGVAQCSKPPFYLRLLSEISSNVPPNQGETIRNDQPPSEFFDHLAIGIGLDKTSRKRKPLAGRQPCPPYRVRKPAGHQHVARRPATISRA